MDMAILLHDGLCGPTRHRSAMSILMILPDPWTNPRTVVVGLAAFSDSWHGLKLVLSRWRCLVPGERRDGAQSRPPALIRVLRNTPKGHNANRWADARRTGVAMILPKDRDPRFITIRRG